MLQELHVKNLALIEEALISFGKGFHVLTGETGAGKSLLLGSVSLALGSKAQPDLVRGDSEFALSEMIFSEDNSDIGDWLKEQDLPYEEGEDIILSRRLSGTRSTCRINGETVTAAKLREAGERLIDIHGQHDHQSLLKKSNHIKILDDYAGERVSELLKETAVLYKEYMKLQSELSECDNDESNRNRETALLEHELKEINEAQLKAGEDEELESRYSLMINSQRLMLNAGKGLELLNGQDGYGDNGVKSLLGLAGRELSEALTYDERLSEIYEIVSSAEGMVSEAVSALIDYMDNLEFNEQDMYETEQRLNTINHLKDRYGKTIEEIMSYAQKLEAELLKYQNYEEYAEDIKRRLAEAEEKLDAVCRELSEERKKASQEFSDRLSEVLKDLNFVRSSFSVAIEDAGSFSKNGRDNVEFLISMNPGEDLKPLAAVASGGELSRIMLAIRSIAAARDGIGTLIFDEIDAGISGRTATQVAIRLAELSKSCQVICITHLPQIAAYADYHYRIEKHSDDDSTITTITELKEDEMLEELVRLLGDTASAFDTARELKIRAKEDKQKI